jgi:prolipoprotein diacylglyceryl transferase
LFGFFIGFKLFPMLTSFNSIENDPQGFILSLDGNFFAGVIGALLFAGYTYLADRKQRVKDPETTLVQIKPEENMGLFTMAAFIAGLLGAKLFHILENLSEFNEKPLASIFAFSGLTFYGGLICGGGMVLYYAWKKRISVFHMLDVGAPAMILAYGLGRIGCHVSGDGDWGIVNKMQKPDWMNFLPDWLWAYNYPNNVNEVCNPYMRGTEEYAANLCNFSSTPYLIDPVFPTPLYEALTCIGLFFLLWSLRKKITFPGVLFGLYLILSGLERFFIEKIRVNTEITFAGITFTQAELISLILILLGVMLMSRKYWQARLKKNADA